MDESILQEVLNRLESIESRLNPPPKPPIVLDAKLIRAFVQWSAHEKHNSKYWTRRQRALLHWWAHEFDGRCLRTVDISKHVIEPLDREPASRAHKIRVLKCLYSWLRKVRHQLRASEDPTVDTLTTPQATPAQQRRVRAVTREHYLKVRRRLTQRWRDCLDLLAATGWHVSELERYIRKGTYNVGRQLAECPRSKRGNILRTRLSARVGCIAARLLQCRTFSEKAFRTALDQASEKGHLPALRPGCMRHSVATYAHDQGEPLARISDYLNHRSTRTTREFYATHSVARRIRNLADG